MSHKKRFDSSFYTTHPKIIRFGNFFSINHMPIVPSFCWYQYYFSDTSGLFRIFIFLEKAKFPISQDLATFKFPKKKILDNIMSNFLNQFSIYFLLQHSDWSQL